MADTQRITYSGTNVDFSPGMGYSKPDVSDIIHSRSKNGTLYSYKHFIKYRWEIPVSFFDGTDAGNINSWWSNVYNLTFVPDMVNAPGTSYTVRIVNSNRPLLQFSGPNWETYYAGTIILEQT
jgi:hypothetical protein